MTRIASTDAEPSQGQGSPTLAEYCETVAPLADRGAAKRLYEEVTRRLSGATGLDAATLGVHVALPRDEWRVLLSQTGTAGKLAACGRLTKPLAQFIDTLRQDVFTPRALSAREIPALSAPVYEDLARLHGRAEPAGNQVLDEDGRALAACDAPQVGEGVAQLLCAGVRLIQSMMGHRLLRWEVEVGHAQWAQSRPDARVISIDGGWKGLAVALGDPDRRSDYRRLVEAQSRVRLRLPDGSCGNLVAYRAVPAVGHRHAQLELTLGTMLMPQFVHGLDSSDPARRLVPLPGFPPLLRQRHNEEHDQLSYQMRVMVYLRKFAMDYAAGGVRIDLVTREHLSRGLLSATMEDRVWDRWIRDGDDAPRFLHAVERHRYVLGEAHGGAGLALHESGRMERRRRRAGQLSARQRDRLGR